MPATENIVQFSVFIVELRSHIDYLKYSPVPLFWRILPVGCIDMNDLDTVSNV